MREKFYRFMAGRYGADQLGRFLSYVTLGLIVLNLLLRSRLLSALCLAGLAVTWYRMLSRDMARRRRENDRYLSLRWKVTGWWSTLTDRVRQRRYYVFFHCPSCRAMLRVPRGKGRIRVTCRKCGSAFERKT